MSSALIFQHKECPEDKTFIEFVKSKVEWDAAVAATSQPIIDNEDLLVSSIANHESVLKEVNLLYDQLGQIFWRSQDSRELSGLSLSYNPDHDKSEWKCGSFGHPRYQIYSKRDYFDKPEKDRSTVLKNDYLDSYGFRRFLPELAAFKELTNLLNSFSLPVIRITARTIDGGYCFPTLRTQNGGMHRDDSIFEMIRINVCLSNNGNFGLQYEGHDPIFPNCGDLYAINSDVSHRVYVNKLTYFKRTHLVIGLTPWLNYNQEADEWYLNEYYGKIHPLDLIKQKLIFKKGTYDI
jgi:hypothetical protein